MTDAFDDDFVQISVDGHIGWLTLSDPDRLNPVTRARVRSLSAAAAALSERDDIHVVVVRGAGRAFCSGADISQTELVDDALPLGGGALMPDEPAMWALTGMRQPVIAMVRGVAVGFGLELALQADLRVASTSARFSAPFAKLGLITDTGAGSWLLPRLIGWSKAAEMYYTGAWYSAAEAHACGLVNQVCEDEQLEDVTGRLAADIASQSPWSLRTMKRLFIDGLQQSRAEHLLVHNQRFNASPRT